MAKWVENLFPYVVVSLSFHFSFWEGRLQVVVSLGFFIWLTIPYFFTSYVSLTSKGQRRLYIHVTTLVEKHIVSIRGILPSAISYCLASVRDFIAQFPQSRGILLQGNLNHSFQYNDYISIIDLWLLHWGRSCCQGITHWLHPWFLGHYALTLRPSHIHDDFHMVVFASFVTLLGTMDRAHGFT